MKIFICFHLRKQSEEVFFIYRFAIDRSLEAFRCVRGERVIVVLACLQYSFTEIMGKFLLFLFRYYLAVLLSAIGIGFLAGWVGAEVLVRLGLLDKNWFYLVPVGFGASFGLAALIYLS